MINLDFFKKQIQTMDVKSDEFFDLYTTVCDKYYTFQDPDDFQKAAMTLRMYIDKATEKHEEQLITFQKILEQLYMMDREGNPACIGTVGFKGKDYHFTIATDKKAIKKMQDIMGKVVNGNFKIKKR